MEDTTIILILFPFGMIALTVIVWFQIYISEKIKEDAFKRCKNKIDDNHIIN